MFVHIWKVNERLNIPGGIAIVEELTLSGESTPIGEALNEVGDAVTQSESSRSGGVKAYHDNVTEHRECEYAQCYVGLSPGVNLSISRSVEKGGLLVGVRASTVDGFAGWE